MASERIDVTLEYPLAHVKEPILYHLVADFRLIPNIHRADIDGRRGGTLALGLQGTNEDLEAGLAFLRGLGIAVTRSD